MAADSPKRDRPTRQTGKITDAICRRIAEGESLQSLCKDPKMPSLASVQGWLADPANEKFRAHYARALEIQADFYADQIIEISDTEENPQKARIRIDARKWKAAKLRPRVYGDKIQQDHRADLALTITTGVPRADD
ncbi:MAG: hypothetical protein HQ483_18310 [Rhodospirillales bacterium]|nr:hypothetical protein [Rhodospirillales bacterium]